MDHNETGCQPAPEGPILCVNNCGFFGSASNMNMCSKCYKDLVLKQEQAKSIENIVNRSSSGVRKESSLVNTAVLQTNNAKAAVVDEPLKDASSSAGVAGEPKPKEGPTRCSTCNKRVGLTPFKCRCGNHFCGSHRYSDKHDCPFDYRAAGQDAIAKANPVVKGAKLNNRI